MKKLIFTLILTGSLLPNIAFAQGRIIFGNFSSGTPGTAASNFVYAPIFNFDGNLLANDNTHFAQLFAAATLAGPYSAIGTPTDFATGGFPGIFSFGDLQVSGFATGTTPFLKVRAWDNAGGSITDYNSAPVGQRGESQPFASLPLGPSGALYLPSDVPNLFGLTSFAIPEPSVVTLASLGGLGLLLRLRRKQ